MTATTHPKPNVVLRAVNTLRSSVKLDAKDLKPDTEAAKAITKLVKDLDSTLKDFEKLETELNSSKQAKFQELDDMLQRTRDQKDDLKAALAACRGLQANHQQLVQIFRNMLQASSSSHRRRLHVKGFSGNQDRISKDITAQWTALQDYASTMTERDKQLQQDFARISGSGMSDSSSALPAKERRFRRLKRALQISTACLGALAVGMFLDPTLGAGSAVSTAAGLITGTAVGRARRDQRRVKEQQKITTALENTQGIPAVIDTCLGRAPNYKLLLDAEVARRAGRVVRMRNSEELNDAMGAWGEQAVLLKLDT